jgi:HD domain.
MSKGERVDNVRNDLDSKEELLRRLPELDAIYVDELRDDAIQTFMSACPDYFWERPSSSTGKYHSVDERGEHGNWIHTKRVFAEYCNIAESWVELGAITPEQKEEGKVAALIHDMMKYGWPSDQSEHTVNDHDLVAADVAANIGDNRDAVVKMIASHMGPWGEGPEPESRNEILLHTADKSAARQHNDVGIYFPAKEIVESWPEITSVEIEEDEKI